MEYSADIEISIFDQIKTEKQKILFLELKQEQIANGASAGELYHRYLTVGGQLGFEHKRRYQLFVECREKLTNCLARIEDLEGELFIVQHKKVV